MIVITLSAITDDVAIIARSEQDLKENFSVLHGVSTTNRIKINKYKMKVMIVSREKKKPVRLDEELREQFSS